MAEDQFEKYCQDKWGLSLKEASDYMNVPEPPKPYDAPKAQKKESKKRRVYFIRGGSRIKIGITVNVKNRLKTMQAHSPIKLKVVGTINGDYALERALHEWFSEYRCHGEWFDLQGDLALFMHEFFEVRGVHKDYIQLSLTPT